MCICVSVCVCVSVLYVYSVSVRKSFKVDKIIAKQSKGEGRQSYFAFIILVQGIGGSKDSRGGKYLLNETLMYSFLTACTLHPFHGV